MRIQVGQESSAELPAAALLISGLGGGIKSETWWAYCEQARGCGAGDELQDKRSRDMLGSC
jgi:hypothetical protein